MTFREKLREEHPSKVNVFAVGGCAGCPCWYGYEENQVFTLCKGANSTNKECEACWNRQMPEDNNIKEKEVNKSMTKEYEAVNHPSHYTSGSVECIDGLKAATTGLEGIEAVCTANAIKYLWRWKHKNGVQDLDKAIWYIERLKKEIDKSTNL